jgi:hypothetical protein
MQAAMRAWHGGAQRGGHYFCTPLTPVVFSPEPTCCSSERFFPEPPLDMLKWAWIYCCTSAPACVHVPISAPCALSLLMLLCDHTQPCNWGTLASPTALNACHKCLDQAGSIITVRRLDSMPMQFLLATGYALALDFLYRPRSSVPVGATLNDLSQGAAFMATWWHDITLIAGVQEHKSL